MNWFLVLIFANYAMWSTTFSIGKATLEVSAPLFLTATRTMLAGALLISFLVIRGQPLRISRKVLLPLFLFALFTAYLGNAFEFWGLQYLASAKACLIYSLSPFLAALFSYFQFKEKVTARKFLGLVIGFVGLLPVLLSSSSIEEIIGGISFLSWPELALIAATACAVYGWILLRRLCKDCHVSPLMANGYGMFLGGAFAMCHSLIAEPWQPVPVTDFGSFFAGMAVMMAISNLICSNIYGALLKRYTATFLSFAGLSTPLFAAFFGWVLLGETVSWEFFLSISIFLVGLWVVHGEELRVSSLQEERWRPSKMPHSGIGN